MFEVASLIVINLLIATVLGFFIGYFFGKKSSDNFEKDLEKSLEKPLEKNEKQDEEVKHNTKRQRSRVNPIFKKNSNVDNKPLILSTPRQSGKDNFLKVRGIDEITMDELNNLGIYHFDQIAKWDNKNCSWIEEIGNFYSNRIKKEQWVEQAKILALGKETVYSLKLENGDLLEESK